MALRIDSFVCVALLTLQVLGAIVSNNDPNKEDLPGHSDLFDVTGSSGIGCQVADHELISYRTEERSGEDDGSLWTGETMVHLRKRFYSKDSKDSEDVRIDCNGTYLLPTVFWLGPYLQGENGTNNNFAIGMLAFETNDTDKSNAWHVYRPCTEYYIDHDPPDDVWFPSPEALQLKADVHLSGSTPPPDNTSIGLSLADSPPGTEVSKTSSPQISFNGAFNGFKEEDEYYYGEYTTSEFKFRLEKDLNCTRLGEFDWERSKGAIASIEPGSVINGTLSNDTLTLHAVGKPVMGELVLEYTGVGFQRTEVEFTFNGKFDSRNSSQNIIVDRSNENIITFSAGSKRSPSISFLYGGLGVITLFSLL